MSVTNQKILKTVETLGTSVETLGTSVETLGVTVETLGATVETLATTMKEGFKKIDGVLENITVMLVNHDHLLKTIPTREEFDTFKSENATAHDRTVKAIEKFDQELASSTASHDRLKKQVDKHQVALVKHKLLVAEPA